MSYSFDIKTSIDLYYELIKKINEYNKNKISSGNAVICAILCWHIVEWIYQEYTDQLVAYDSKRKFQDEIKKQCPSLDYMQDIANGSKHRGITMYTPTVKTTESHNGAFSSGFSKGFDVPCLKMELEDKVVVYFDEEIEKSINFIQSLFKNELNENV